MEPISISIEKRTYPMVKPGTIGQPTSLESFDFIEFGDDYAGTFILRHPNLGDQLKIGAAQSNSLIAAGYRSVTDALSIPQEQEYAFAAVKLLAIEPVPGWFNQETLSTYRDQWAVIEVGRALNEAIQAKKNNSSNGSTSKS